MIQAPERSMIKARSINNSKSYGPISVKFNIQNIIAVAKYPVNFKAIDT